MMTMDKDVALALANLLMALHKVAPDAPVGAIIDGVARAVGEKPRQGWVHHIDGNPRNNDPNNLRIVNCTPSRWPDL